MIKHFTYVISKRCIVVFLPITTYDVIVVVGVSGVGVVDKS